MKKALLAIPAFGAVASFAQESAASTAATALATNMTQLTGDVTNTIGPAAIGLAIAIAVVVIGRSFIRKFFKV